MKHIRNLYEQLGVEKYYQDYGDQYLNPHLEQVQELLVRLVNNNAENLDFSSVLDFCAGGGEVSFILQELGYKNITGSDPFTQKLYEKNLNQKCFNWSFDDVIKGKLTGTYSCIICSFAMHLCEEEKLYPLAFQLFQHSPSLVILTPHKRPQLEKLDGIRLDFEDFALTVRGKKVFLKSYVYGY